MMSLKEIAAEIRTTLKAEFPEWKFSVTVKDHIAIEIRVMSGPENPLADEFSYDRYNGPYKRTWNGVQLHPNSIVYQEEMGYMHVSGYSPAGWYSNGCRLTDSAAEMLKRVAEIQNKRNWDKSDPMTDYFNVGFYTHLEIGRWDKAFEVKTKQSENCPG